MASPGAAHSTQANAGAYQKGVAALTPTRVGAGLGGSGVFANGEAINRVDPVVALSLKFVTVVSATQASGESTTVRQRVEHRDGVESWAEPSTDVLTQPDDVVLTAADAGGAVVSSLSVNVDLSGLKSQVRLTVRPTLSASGTSVVAMAAAAVLGGLDTIPQADAELPG